MGASLFNFRLLSAVLILFLRLTASVEEDELESMFAVLRARGYNLFSNAIATSDLSFEIVTANSSAAAITFFAATDSSLFDLDLANTASDYTSVLRCHVVPGLRLSFNQLRHFPAGYSLRTLANNHSVRIVQEISSQGVRDSLSVDGVDVVAPGLFYSNDIAVHGLGGILNCLDTGPRIGSGQELPPPEPPRPSFGSNSSSSDPNHLNGTESPRGSSTEHPPPESPGNVTFVGTSGAPAPSMNSSDDWNRSGFENGPMTPSPSDLTVSPPVPSNITVNHSTALPPEISPSISPSPMNTVAKPPAFEGLNNSTLQSPEPAAAAEFSPLHLLGTVHLPPEIPPAQSWCSTISLAPTSGPPTETQVPEFSENDDPAVFPPSNIWSSEPLSPAVDDFQRIGLDDDEEKQEEQAIEAIRSGDLAGIIDVVPDNSIALDKKTRDCPAPVEFCHFCVLGQ